MSKDDPLSYQQVRNYFNPLIGDSCLITPAADDVLNSTGTIDLINDPTVFSINRPPIDGKIIIKAESDTADPWRIETLGNESLIINLLKNEVGKYISEIELRDFAIFQNNPGNVVTILSNMLLGEEEFMSITFRDFLVIAKNNLDVAARPNSEVKCYGYSWSANKIYLVPSN